MRETCEMEDRRDWEDSLVERAQHAEAEVERLREALEAALWLAEDAHPAEARTMRARLLSEPISSPSTRTARTETP